MNCHEAAEFVSALYDGETIPQPAAEHLGACSLCQAQLSQYLQLGAELRRLASLSLPQAATPPLWDKPQRGITRWWRKGWETMSIPRWTFALMSAGLVILGSSLAVVGVRAHSQGSVLLLKMTPGAREPLSCPLSAEDPKLSRCGGIARVEEGMLSYQFKLLKKEGDRVTLGVRTRFSASTSGSFLLSDLDTQPETPYSFEPGQTLQVQIAGLGSVPVKGEWTDHMPSVNAEERDLDPGATELRVVSPLLLRGNTVIGDMEGGSAIEKDAQHDVAIYMPGAGRFQLSLAPSPGAVLGQARLNRLTFAINGDSYVLLTGAPIARTAQVWVRRDAHYQPTTVEAGGFIGGAEPTPAAPTNPAPR